jgi:hypothetical protein
MNTKTPSTSSAQSLKLPEAFRKARITMSAPEDANAAADTAEAQETELGTSEDLDSSEAEQNEADIVTTTERRFTIIDLDWRVKPVSVRNDLVADTPIGRMVISTRFLTGGPICDLSLPQIGDNAARKVPCESIEEAQKLARQEIALVVQQLIVEREDINVV